MRNGFERSSAISAARALPVMSWTVEQSHACWPGGPHALISSASSAADVASRSIGSPGCQLRTISPRMRWLTTFVEPPGAIVTP